MKKILKCTINNVVSIRNHKVEESNKKSTNSINSTKQNSTIMDIINKVRSQRSLNKTLENDNNKQISLVNNFKNRKRVNLKRLDSNLLVIRDCKKIDSIADQYKQFAKRSSSIRASPINSKTKLDSISESVHTSNDIKKSLNAIQKYQFSCPLPPRSSKINIEHKRNYSTFIMNQTQLTHSNIESGSNEELKESQKKISFQEIFNKRLKYASHKRSFSRNEEKNIINSQFSVPKSAQKASQILSKRGELLPPLKSKIIVLQRP